MIMLQGLKDRLIDGRLSLTLCEFGDGMRGVALFEQGSDTPIERVALARWAVDQEDGLQYADKDAAPGWYYRVFGCDAHGCRLSNQAREALQDHCRRNEDAILAWCDGDTTAVLPAFGATNDATTFTTYIARPAMAYGQPGYDDALAAAAAINKSLGDSGESSFMVGDEAADHSAYRAMQRELDSCAPIIRGNLYVDSTSAEIDEQPPQPQPGR